jgi:hypothetical protein
MAQGGYPHIAALPAAMQQACVQGSGTQLTWSTFALRPRFAVTSLRIMPEEKTTVLCPACKSRMSVKQISHAMAKNTDEFIYHCAMCDIEIKQQVPHLSTAALSPPQAPKFPL